MTKINLTLVTEYVSYEICFGCQLATALSAASGDLLVRKPQTFLGVHKLETAVGEELLYIEL
jgi:hypothetical protein